MASNINPTNIDGNYPVAGQDNDSQGFRDNFTNIKNNLQYAKNELDDLQSKVLLKSALTGGTLQNDMSYGVLYRPQIKSPAITFKDHGTTSGSVVISYLDGAVHKVQTAGTALGVTLSDFPPTGHYAVLRLWLKVVFSPSQANTVVTLPSSVTLGGSNVPNWNAENRTITYTAAGDYMLELFTVDGGANFWIHKIP